MKFDDPTLLSAFLDNELDGDERRQVELALSVNPRLAREYADLKAVRNALSLLPAPQLPSSVSRNVAVVIAGRSTSQSRLQVQARLAMLWVSVGVIAASFVLAWTLQLLSLRDAGIRRGFSFRGDEPNLSLEPESGMSRGDVPQPAPLVAAAESADIDASSIPSPEVVLAVEPVTAQSQLRDLLGRAEARRLAIKVSSLDSEEVRQLDRALHEVPRFEAMHARMGLLENLSVDAQAKGESLVYAVVLDDSEYANLVSRLERVPGMLLSKTDESVPPQTLALLAETNNVSFFEVMTSGTVVDVEALNNESLGKRDRESYSEPTKRNSNDEPSFASKSTPGPFSSDGIRGASKSRFGRREWSRSGQVRDRVTPEVFYRDIAGLASRLDTPGFRLLDDGRTVTPANVFVCLIWVSADSDFSR